MNIKYLIMDVDGTLTDGKIYIGNDGEELKAFNVKDGCGIKDIAIPIGIVPVIITARTSRIVEKRSEELGIKHVYQGIRDKFSKMDELCDDLSQVAYIGDDILDLSCMLPVKQAGGLIGCPSDAVKSVLEIADFISEHKGGEGAVRDFIEWIVGNKSA